MLQMRRSVCGFYAWIIHHSNGTRFGSSLRRSVRTRPVFHLFSVFRLFSVFHFFPVFRSKRDGERRDCLKNGTKTDGNWGKRREKVMLWKTSDVRRWFRGTVILQYQSRVYRCGQKETEGVRYQWIGIKNSSVVCLRNLQLFLSTVIIRELMRKKKPNGNYILTWVVRLYATKISEMGRRRDADDIIV